MYDCPSVQETQNIVFDKTQLFRLLLYSRKGFQIIFKTLKTVSGEFKSATSLTILQPYFNNVNYKGYFTYCITN